jgi:predicted small metal-binding protein
MKKEIRCPCGYVIRADSEESLVAEAKQHAKDAHDMDLTTEQALAMARPA